MLLLLALACTSDAPETESQPLPEPDSTPPPVDDSGEPEDTGEPDDTGASSDTGEPDDTGGPGDTGDPGDTDDPGDSLPAPLGDISLSGMAVTGDSGSELGRALASAGDIDGDGTRDLLVGALESGEVWVLPRDVSAGTLPKAPVLSARGAGGSIAAGGDLDEDGYDDVFIGISGGAWRAYGPITGDRSASDDWTNESGSMNRLTVAAPGDLSGDGQPDLLVAAAQAGDAASNGGMVWLLDATASAGPIRERATASISGSVTNGYAGSNIDGPGDLNGDGVADLLVGA